VLHANLDSSCDKRHDGEFSDLSGRAKYWIRSSLCVNT